MESGGIAPPFLITALDAGEWSDPRPIRYTRNPCGGGVEYLHRDPASRKRRRNGTKKGRAIA
jgi:hypothetical protein